MRLLWLNRALLNLEQAAAYVHEENPAAAKMLVQKIRRSAKRLRQFPETGRAGRVEGTRELVIPGLPYILVYRIREDTVQILRVFHTSRRWPEGFYSHSN